MTTPENFPGFWKKIVQVIFPDINQENWLVLFFLSLFTGLYTLLCIIAIFLPGGIIEAEETDTFVLGWVLAPTIAVFSIPFFLWVRSKYFKNIPDALLILLSANSLAFALFITAMNLSWQFEKSFSLTTNIAYAAVLFIPLINLAVILLLKSSGEKTRYKSSWIPAILGGLGLVNFIGIYPYLDNQYSIPVSAVVISAVAGLLLTTLIFLMRPSQKMSGLNRFWLYGVDAATLVFIIITCFDPTFTLDSHHENFYLGPANRILHGGSMLVDAYSQYGNLVIYFLALVLKLRLIPFTYQGLTLVITGLFMGQFSIIYFWLIKLLKSRFYAVPLLILSILFGFFGATGIIQGYPSTGPLRFGLIYLMLTVVFLRSRYPSFRRAGLWIEYILIGLVFLWSFEAFVYVGFSYLGICLFESFNQSATLQQSIKKFLVRGIWFLLSVVMAFGLFSLFTYARAKVWPDWSIYFDFIRTYSSLGGFGDLPIDTWSPWIFPIAIYFTSLMIFAFRYIFLKRRENTAEDKLVLGLTLAGIAMFTYYLGRSHPNNLFHITIPAIIVSSYWFYKLVKNHSYPGQLRFAGSAALFSAAVLIILGVWPAFSTKYQNGNTGLAIFSHINSSLLSYENVHQWLSSEYKLLHVNVHYKQIREAHALIKQYMPGKTAIPVFLSFTGNTELLFTTGRVHTYPISDMTEDNISSKNVQRVLSYPTPLKAGDVILLEKDPSFYQDKELYGLQAQIIGKLCQEFTFEEVKTTPNFILVTRLKPHDSTPSSYCGAIEAINKKNLTQ